MKRMLLALGLSALTLVGGHFYNRRWDRAVLFLVALVFWGLGVWIVAVSDAMGGGSRDFFGFIHRYWRIFLWGMAAIWMVSLVVAAFDAHRFDASAAPRSTALGVVGASGLSLLLALFFGAQALAVLWVTTGGIRFGEPDLASMEPESYSLSFHHYVPFGTLPGPPHEFPRPPDGDGYLRGRFTYDGKPAAGIALRLALNGKYESESVTTGADGIFALRLPPGKWSVNALRTEGWDSRPDTETDFLIVTGEEPKLANGRYDQHFYWLDSKGKRVSVTEQPGEPQLELTIRKHVVMNWPNANERRAPATVADSMIDWEAYPGAHTYLLRIVELKSMGGSSTRLIPIATQRITDGATSFALANFEAAPGGDGNMYRVSVLAFARDNTFLSESKETFDRLTFVLTDGQQLVRAEERELLGPSYAPEDVELLRENGRRIEAMETLLKDGLVDEAERLLAKIEGPVEPGRRAAITGYLMAKRGRCAEAKQYFERARAEGGVDCIPRHYQASCE